MRKDRKPRGRVVYVSFRVLALLWMGVVGVAVGIDDGGGGAGVEEGCDGGDGKFHFGGGKAVWGGSSKAVSVGALR